MLEQIVAHTDGVPLFIEELTKSVLESKLLREEGDGYVLDGPLPTLAIPTTLRDSLIARLDRLAPIREIAQIGACIGREFPYELLAGIATSEDQLEAALDSWSTPSWCIDVAHRPMRPTSSSMRWSGCGLRLAAQEQARSAAGRIAHALNTRFAHRVANGPELLAHHYTEAGDLKAAVPLWRRAGEQALARVALRETVAHLQNGLALLERLPASDERDELELSIREPLTAAWTGLRGWAWPELSTNGAAILELAKRRAKPGSILLGLWGIWVNAASQGRIAQSLEEANRILAEARKARDSDLEIFGHWTAVVSHYYLGQLLQAREHGDRVLELYDPQRRGRWMQLTGSDIRTGVESYAAHWMWMLGYPDQAVRISDAKDAYAEQLGHAFNLGFALSFGAAAFDHRCEPGPLLARIDRAYQIAHEQSIPFLYQLLIPSNEGVARLRAGQLSESVSILRQHLQGTRPPV